MRKLPPDPTNIERLQAEGRRLEKIEFLFNTEQGKEFLKLINERFDKSIGDFLDRDIASLSDSALIAFAYSVRGRLQELRGLRRYAETAKVEKEIIFMDLKQYE